MEKHEMNTYGVAEKPLNREVLRGILVSSAHPQIRSRVVSPTAKQWVKPVWSIFHFSPFLS